MPRRAGLGGHGRVSDPTRTAVTQAAFRTSAVRQIAIRAQLTVGAAGVTPVELSYVASAVLGWYSGSALAVLACRVGSLGPQPGGSP